MGAGAFQTRFGVYNFDADGEATVKNLLRRECILRLLKNDKRCNQLDIQRLLDSGYFPTFLRYINGRQSAVAVDTGLLQVMRLITVVSKVL